MLTASFRGDSEDEVAIHARSRLKALVEDATDRNRRGRGIGALALRARRHTRRLLVGHGEASDRGGPTLRHRFTHGGLLAVLIVRTPFRPSC